MAMLFRYLAKVARALATGQDSDIKHGMHLRIYRCIKYLRKWSTEVHCCETEGHYDLACLLLMVIHSDQLQPSDDVRNQTWGKENNVQEEYSFLHYDRRRALSLCRKIFKLLQTNRHFHLTLKNSAEQLQALVSHCRSLYFTNNLVNGVLYAQKFAETKGQASFRHLDYKASRETRLNYRNDMMQIMSSWQPTREDYERCLEEYRPDSANYLDFMNVWKDKLRGLIFLSVKEAPQFFIHSMVLRECLRADHSHAEVAATAIGPTIDNFFEDPLPREDRYELVQLTL